MATDHKDARAVENRSASDSGGINSGVAIIGFLLSFLAGGLLMYGFDHRQGGISADVAGSASATKWSDSDSPIPVDSRDPMWGNREAPVTLVLFSDFQCPFCSKVGPTYDQIKTTYGKDKVRIVWKNRPLPFHQNAKPAAEAAMAVFALQGSEGFWKFHDTAFKNQQSLTRESYEKWAQAAGADLAKFKKALDAHSSASKVEEDDKLAQSVGAGGTPASFVNGVLVSGAQPFEQFKKIIDQELDKAKSKIASGTAKDKVYVAMTKDNFKKPAAKEEEEEKEDTKTVWRIPAGKDSPAIGGDKALVTILVFSDFQCPFCKRVEDTLKKARETYGEKVRVVWKNEPLPFHPRAEPAAELAYEARAEKGDKGFWEAHGRLFDSQPKLDDADLEKIATDMKLDVNKVKAAIKDKKYTKQITADHEVGVTFQVQGTPHMFINGRRLVGAQPFEKFKEIIDEEVTRAQALVSRGVKYDALYDELIKDGKAGGSAPAAGGGAPAEKKNIAIPSNAPFKGGAKAKVVIQQFSDFQCPFCSRVEPTIDQVLKEYGDKVKLVWRNLPLPFHQDAMPAAEAAMEAYKQKGSDGFWKMHGLMFKNQQAIKRENLETYAQQIGLDMGKFKAALDNHTHQPGIEADRKAGNDAGINGTPGFSINGVLVSGAQPFDQFKSAIDKELAAAK